MAGRGVGGRKSHLNMGNMASLPQNQQNQFLIGGETDEYTGYAGSSGALNDPYYRSTTSAAGECKIYLDLEEVFL